MLVSIIVPRFWICLVSFGRHYTQIRRFFWMTVFFIFFKHLLAYFSLSPKRLSVKQLKTPINNKKNTVIQPPPRICVHCLLAAYKISTSYEIIFLFLLCTKTKFLTVLVKSLFLKSVLIFFRSEKILSRSALL